MKIQTKLSILALVSVTLLSSCNKTTEPTPTTAVGIPSVTGITASADLDESISLSRIDLSLPVFSEITISIAGSNFANGMTATVGGVNLRNVVIVSSNLAIGIKPNDKSVTNPSNPEVLIQNLGGFLSERRQIAPNYPAGVKRKAVKELITEALPSLPLITLPAVSIPSTPITNPITTSGSVVSIPKIISTVSGIVSESPIQSTPLTTTTSVAVPATTVTGFIPEPIKTPIPINKLPINPTSPVVVK